ncbi:hypothetical protein SAMN06297164_2412 [Nitrosomonas ureae]|uniref:Uncharacterized protein n=1 Tax=Nitrosomonas ureae TaxID=44577 RepID=A0A286ABZ9_9PROT|nr:hypothetical protein SAMN06297164_2412 [Nitrosomonas ureae]
MKIEGSKYKMKHPAASSEVFCILQSNQPSSQGGGELNPKRLKRIGIFSGVLDTASLNIYSVDIKEFNGQRIYYPTNDAK